ncbi:hypothetical protein PsYK624_080870 [Phanerochaete sordida]|uniref:Tyrosine-protein kinase ephrin type A/B receptor-like domain-containing protein n=1 Tax=Phanerochaete sordida TaxID=48140 RepID=A0A9P3GDR5_9APHY|nr:hypothetical protein PsYK624_080870 [Phanerochaete sordida]
MPSRAAAYVSTVLLLLSLVPHASAACAPGTFTPDGGRDCIPCPPGTYSDATDQATCKQARPGYFAPPGATSETPCAAGSYSAGLAARCTLCYPGSYCPGEANVAPTLCAPGTFSGVAGAEACCSCCAGWYSEEEGAITCTSCPSRGPFKQGYSPVGGSSADDCVAAIGARDSCSQISNTCPNTGGALPSGGVQKRSPPRTQRLRCAPAHSKCPVYGIAYGRGYTRGYECVDTQSDLERCGGCVDGDSWDGARSAGGGRDCSAIPDVDAVRCARGQCIIERCRRGYIIHDGGTACRPLFVASGWR